MIIYMRIIRLFIYHVIQRQLAAHNVDEHNFNSITLHQIKREKKTINFTLSRQMNRMVDHQNGYLVRNAFFANLTIAQLNFIVMMSFRFIVVRCQQWQQQQKH